MQHIMNGFYKHNDRIIYYDVLPSKLEIGAIINSTDCKVGICGNSVFENLMAFYRLRGSEEACRGSNWSMESPIVKGVLGDAMKIEGLITGEQKYEVYGEWGEKVRGAAYQAAGQMVNDSCAVMMLLEGFIQVEMPTIREVSEERSVAYKNGEDVLMRLFLGCWYAAVEDDRLGEIKEVFDWTKVNWEEVRRNCADSLHDRLLIAVQQCPEVKGAQNRRKGDYIGNPPLS